MKIKVTLADILCGKQFASEACMLARAVRRALPDAIAVRVGYEVLEVHRAGSVQEVQMPDELAAKVHTFDRNRLALFPFTFELPLETAPARGIYTCASPEAVSEAVPEAVETPFASVEREQELVAA